MKGVNLKKLSDRELVSFFEKVALAQDEATFADDIQKINRYFWELEKIEGELKSRPGDRRHDLLELLHHPNPQVQVKVAKATLAIAPEAARAVLEDIAKNCYGPQKLEAGMSLRNLDAGIFKPT